MTPAIFLGGFWWLIGGAFFTCTLLFTVALCRAAALEPDPENVVRFPARLRAVDEIGSDVDAVVFEWPQDVPFAGDPNEFRPVA